jgi:hypothetical protein
MNASEQTYQVTPLPGIVEGCLISCILAVNVEFKLQPTVSRPVWNPNYIFAKRKQPGITLTKMYWLLGCESHLTTSNKFLIYKAILKPIWTYKIQLWVTTSTFNIEILECFQLKTLHMIVDAPWYVPNINKDDSGHTPSKLPASATSTTSRPAIAINRRPVTSRAPHNASCVFTDGMHFYWHTTCIMRCS